MPALACTALLAIIGLGQIDIGLADRIYALGGNQWSWRDAFLAEDVVHVGGRNLSLALWVTTLLAWLVAAWHAHGHALRRPFAYLLLATLVSTLLVSFFKSWSNMDCPWDLVRYGGERPYVGFFSLRPVGLERGRCFPAGHASGGYAWFALYFFFATVRPRWRGFGLAFGAGLGLVFGVSQQLRGAHFLSHDVCTAAICWFVALALHLVMWRRSEPARAPTEGER
jgi:membrane-associated PAP2 superfamily phosphatase